MRAIGHLGLYLGLLWVLPVTDARAGMAPSPPPGSASQPARAPAVTPPPPPSAKTSTQRSGTSPPPPPGSSRRRSASSAGTRAAGGERPADPFVDTDMSPSTDLSKTWGYSSGRELEPNYIATKRTSVEATPNPIGFYSGVSVQGDNPPPIPAPALGTIPAVVTFPGYEASSGGSRVFLQLSAPARHEVAQEGLRIQVRLYETAVNVRNNKRPLDLRFFQTPVQSVSLRTEGADTIATITLKRESTPTTQMIQGANGYYMFVLEFAK